MWTVCISYISRCRVKDPTKTNFHQLFRKEQSFLIRDNLIYKSCESQGKVSVGSAKCGYRLLFTEIHHIELLLSPTVNMRILDSSDDNLENSPRGETFRYSCGHLGTAFVKT
jgi:hypothetical protein